jgi:hypothetical protein
MPKTKRQPSPKAIPQRKPPHPRPAGLPAAETSADRICWRFKHADHDGPWCFHEVDSDRLCDMLKQLANFESMTMAEAFKGEPGKDYNIEELPNTDARKRLETLKLADQTRISRFSLSGKERLYGFRLGNVFHIVWWDPQHEIWPSKKRHT